MPRPNMTEKPSLKNTEKPILQLDLAGEVGSLSFRSIEEIDYWFQKERTFWSWLSAAAQQDGSVNSVFANQCYGESELQSLINSARQVPDDAQQAQFVQGIANTLRERYQSRRAVLSTSPKAKFVAGLADKVMAAYTLWFLMGFEPQSRNRRESIAAALAAAFEYGYLKDGSKAFELAIDDLRQRAETDHEALRLQAGRLADRFEALHEQVVVLHGEQRKQFDEAQSSRQTLFQTELERAKGELRNIAETYDKKMALQAAVTYLTDKARGHSVIAAVWGVVALLAAAGFVVVAEYIAMSVFGDADPPWHRLAAAGLAATLGFWLLRILVRLFLSNLHLSSDIRSRATLMQTYLALLREGGALQDDDRKLILQMLFRPTSDGLVRDDGAPPGPWETLTRGLLGR